MIYRDGIVDLTVTHNRLTAYRFSPRLNDQHSRLFRGNQFGIGSTFVYYYFDRSSLSNESEGRYSGILPSILGYVYYVTLISERCFYHGCIGRSVHADKTLRIISFLSSV